MYIVLVCKLMYPAESEGEVFGEVTAGEVGKPSVGCLVHRTCYGLEGGDGGYFTGERGSVCAVVVLEEWQDTVYIHHIQQLEEFGVHVDERLRSMVGPFLIEEDIVVEGYVLATVKEAVQSSGVENGV